MKTNLLIIIIITIISLYYFKKMGGPNLNNLLSEYVDTIAVLPVWATTGDRVDNYFKIKNEFTEVSLFNNPKFERKLKQLNITPAQENNFWFLANQYNRKVQNSFN